ncbi:uncharacterized protein BKA55DRAFT_579488 [Fusarium redolens]|uniref:Uncharacterized protein n=1 Tax=Fusarium redolens TaxID=48865 RepID=A0A9P9GA55_FUSRE|nr:uncharacterized protein BKA55DRAFT_579488 [Fusarium redolens]KAH7234812.1 hypothetical protein BKA55DRAFT_579488 [Fusarium redolens]
MSGQQEHTNGGSSPVEVASASGKNPVQIILTPPTPIVSAGNFDRRGEDTFKEVLPAVSEEKEVVQRTDGYDEKEVYAVSEGHDEKEVYIPAAEKEVYDHGLEKEVHDLRLHDGHDEKQIYDPTERIAQAQCIDSPEKEVLPPTNHEDHKGFHHPNYSTQSLPTQDKENEASMAVQKYNSNVNERRESISTASTETSETKDSAARGYYQRHLNKWNQAVDKKKKAWTTFANNSSTTMTEKANQIDKGLKDRCTAFENGTTAKLNQLDRSISDSVDRAGKNVNTKVANWKTGMGNMKSQSMSNFKTLGSRCQIGAKEGKEEKETQ